ncbi:MAG TPA: calcium-binding protein [Phenylobacterium sp.]
MPASTSFTFYGVVEGVIDPQPSFDLAPGEKVTAHMALSGAAADAYLDAFEDETTLFWDSPQGVALTFQGTPLTLREELFLRSNGTDLSLVNVSLIGARFDADPSQPPGSLFFYSSQFYFGGAQLTEQEGNGEDAGQTYGTADISGAWIPDDIDPNLIYGSSAGEVLKARGEVSMLWGMGGADTLQGASQSFYGWGGAGADSLRGSGEEDQLWGGFGDDTVQGRGGADLLNGMQGNDSLGGGDGEDTLQGREGNDRLRGDAGDDDLTGGGGEDSLWGGAGDDTLVESAFADGGTGDDLIFVFERAHGGGGEDIFRIDFALTPQDLVIDDFHHGQDLIQIYGPDPGWANFIAHAAQVGPDVVFSWDGEAVLTLENARLSGLRASDFDFLF